MMMRQNNTRQDDLHKKFKKILILLGKSINHIIKKTRALMTQKRISDLLFFSSFTRGALIMDHSK